MDPRFVARFLKVSSVGVVVLDLAVRAGNLAQVGPLATSWHALRQRPVDHDARNRRVAVQHPRRADAASVNGTVGAAMILDSGL